MKQNNFSRLCTVIIVGMEILRIAKACLGIGPTGLLFLLTHDLFSLRWILLTADLIVCAVFLLLFLFQKAVPLPVFLLTFMYFAGVNYLEQNPVAAVCYLSAPVLYAYHRGGVHKTPDNKTGRRCSPCTRLPSFTDISKQRRLL